MNSTESYCSRLCAYTSHQPRENHSRGSEVPQKSVTEAKMLQERCDDSSFPFMPKFKIPNSCDEAHFSVIHV